MGTSGRTTGRLNIHLVQSPKQAVLRARGEAAEQLVQVPRDIPRTLLHLLALFLTHARQHLRLEAVGMPLAQEVLDTLLGRLIPWLVRREDVRLYLVVRQLLGLVWRAQHRPRESVPAEHIERRDACPALLVLLEDPHHFLLGQLPGRLLPHLALLRLLFALKLLELPAGVLLLPTGPLLLVEGRRCGVGGVAGPGR